MLFTATVSAIAIIRSMDEFSEKYRSLMGDLCIFVDEFFANIDELSTNKLYIYIIYSILSIGWNLSDKIPLVPMLVAAHYAENSVKWVEKLPFVGNMKIINKPVMAIIHNLTRDKEGLEALVEHDAFKTLMKRKPHFNLEEDYELGGLAQSFGMSIIALTTSDDDQKENRELILTVSYKLFFMCKNVVDSSTADLRYKGFHLSELLNSLSGAFSNTLTLRYILGDETAANSERIAFFAKLLVSFYGSLLNQEADYLEEIIGKSLLKILLYISNYENYRAELIKHDQFCVLIECLSNRSEQNIVKRIRCNLNLASNCKELSSQQKVKKQPMIFVSYNWNWDDIAICLSLVHELNKLTDIPILVDSEKLGLFEDNLDDISLAIDRATVIIVLLSSAYCESPINFQELTYAVTRSRTELSSERSSYIFLEIEKDTTKKREWLSNLVKDLSKENEIISYDKNQHTLALKIIEKNTFLKSKRELIAHSTGTAVQSRVCTIM